MGVRSYFIIRVFHVFSIVQKGVEMKTAVYSNVIVRVINASIRALLSHNSCVVVIVNNLCSFEWNELEHNF